MSVLRFTKPVTQEKIVEFQARFDKLFDEAMNELGTDTAMGLVNQLQQKAEAFNTQTFTYAQYHNEWLKNFKENIPYFKDCSTDWLKLGIRESAISVGAGPSLTDEQLEALVGYKGVVLAANKSLERLLEYRVPHFLSLIHGTEEILPHFKPQIVKDNLSKIHIIISSSISPSVVKEIIPYADPKKVHWFNSTVPEPIAGDYDEILHTIAPFPTIDTGGNVGIFGLILAENLGAKKVGMLGMEHALKLTYEWSNEDANLMTYYFFPEQKQLFALPPVFRNYIGTIMQWYGTCRDHIEVVNLTPAGLFYFKQKESGIRYMDIKDFISQYK